MKKNVSSSIASLFLVSAGCMVGTVGEPPRDDHAWELRFFDSNYDGTMDAVDVDGDLAIDYYFDYASCMHCRSGGVGALTVCTDPIVDDDDDGLPDGLDFDCDGELDVELFDDCGGFPFCDGGGPGGDGAGGDGGSGDDGLGEDGDSGSGGDGFGGDGGDTPSDGGAGEDGDSSAGEDGTEEESAEDGDIDGLDGLDGADDESGNGGSSSVSICSVSVSINGHYMAVSCKRNGDGPSVCTCDDGGNVYACETNSDSACSIPDGNCCGFSF